VPLKLVINKYDLNLDMVRKIENYCKDNNVEVVGKISFDRDVVNSMVNGQTIIEYKNGKTKNEIINVWERVQQKD